MSIAIFVAELSYLLGIILYAAPIPHPNVKAAAREFMEESGRLIVGLLVIDFFLYVVSLQLSYIEMTLSEYVVRADSLVSEMASLQTTTVTAVAILGIFVFGAFLVFRLFRNFFILTPEDIRQAMQQGARACSTLAQVISPLCMVYGLVTLIQVFFKAYCLLILTHWTTLVALGILLYLIPFKIGRPASKFLIGFGMISYLTIPLYNEISKLFQKWIEKTFQILMWFPIKIAVFEIVFPIFYFGLIAWLLAAIAGVSWIPTQYAAGLSWITPIRRFMSSGVKSLETLGKAAAGLVPGGKKEEGEEEGEVGGEEQKRPPAPPEEGVGEERRRPPLPPGEGEERRPSPPTPKEGVEERERTPEVPSEEFLREKPPAPPSVGDFDTERFEGTLFEFRKGVSASEREEFKRAFEELPESHKRGIGTVRIGEERPEHVKYMHPEAVGIFYPDMKEIRVFGEWRSSGMTPKEIISHEVGHALFKKLPLEKQREFYKVYLNAKNDWHPLAYDQRVHNDERLALDEFFAYSYTDYHTKGRYSVHSAVRSFMDELHGYGESTPYIG
ncbi:MAG: hypothetical protein QXR38_04170 [Nitrososphaerales archaeon]